MTRLKSVLSLAVLMAVVPGGGPGERVAEAQTAPAMGPLKRHPTNPRYFADGAGRAVYLTGSHVWNNLQDRSPTSPPQRFDYTGYLDFLRARNHNFIRMWQLEHARLEFPGEVGYVEPLPWARTGPGTALDGKPRFNLHQFNAAFFDRLRARVVAARDRGIYVGIMLFEGYSLHSATAPWHWAGHPMNAGNNVNGINGDANGNGSGTDIQTLPLPAGVQEIQRAYIRKVVDTVNDLDNVLYEVVNESGGYSTSWQYDVINYLKSYQAGKPKQHPVGMTFQWHPRTPGTNANLFNSPADWISPNASGGYDSNPPAADGRKVVLVDTDHIWGSSGGDAAWVWKTFTRGNQPIFMDGGIEFGPPANDWRESARRAMGHTLTYARRVNLAAMTPRGDLASTGYALANPGSEYIVYQSGSGGFTVNLAAGTYAVEWFNPNTGAVSAGANVSGGGTRSFTPPFAGLAALYLKATSAAPPGGSGTGLTGQYYDNLDFTALAVTRTDATVNFDWGGGAPASGMGADTFSVRWSGQVEAPATGTYTFYTVSDDGVRLWVNGVRIIDNWTLHAAKEDVGMIGLAAGQKVDVRMEFFENGGLAVAKLLWSGPGIGKQIVPRERLYPSAATPPSGGTGLTGQYYDNLDFTNLKVTRVDATVNFDWALGAPATGVGADTFSVRWTGRVQAPATGTYTFYTVADDGVRLWIDGRLLVDNWREQAATERSGTIALSGGQSYAVRMEYYENGVLAVARLLWSGPGFAKQVVPQSRLFPN